MNNVQVVRSEQTYTDPDDLPKVNTVAVPSMGVHKLISWTKLHYRSSAGCY